MQIVLLTILTILLGALVLLLFFREKLIKVLVKAARTAAPPVAVASPAVAAAVAPVSGRRLDFWLEGDAAGAQERKDLLILESLLFASSRPLDVVRAATVLDKSEEYTRKTLGVLRNEYRSAGRSFLIDEVATGFKMVSRGDYGKYISNYYKIKVKTALSRQALETLAVIAYKQPITRSEIETVRGVSVDAVVAGLMERNLACSRGRRAGVGRPLLFGTSGYFLEYFGLKSLDELPTLDDIEPLEEIKRGANFLTEYERRLQKTGFEDKDGELPFDGDAKPGAEKKQADESSRQGSGQVADKQNGEPGSERDKTKKSKAGSEPTSKKKK